MAAGNISMTKRVMYVAAFNARLAKSLTAILLRLIWYSRLKSNACFPFRNTAVPIIRFSKEVLLSCKIGRAAAYCYIYLRMWQRIEKALQIGPLISFIEKLKAHNLKKNEEEKIISQSCQSDHCSNFHTNRSL
ncbi:hypothetical protein HELRODRAFT_160357 [Helobdella robusta]|uniref:Uncharacterized protein n=1 Tax=Helobdella robusta TaxID=6412 RepID=T1EQ49_HELRO|nr:hypothetical protein HELRODRAFT_160357 [Helobdella robusta]ESO06200.1 hypothetical protein HELRODRAFT_160357 [Helobdella robusta]